MPRRPSKPAPSTDASTTVMRYRADMADMAFQLSLLGHADADLARVFSVPIQTLTTWRKRHPKLDEAIANGRDRADAAVANAYYKRAVGYTQKQQRTVNSKHGVQVVTVEETIPPDPSACRTWLASRHRQGWGEQSTLAITPPPQPSQEGTPRERVHARLAGIFRRGLSAPTDLDPDRKKRFAAARASAETLN